MAAADYIDVAQQLYVSYFGRPADPYGLDSYTKQLDALKAPTKLADLETLVASKANPALNALINSFNNSDESIKLYGNDNTQLGVSKFVAALYQNIFGREADVGGAKWWIDEIVSGRVTRANAALSITQGAFANTSDEAKKDQAAVLAKLGVAKDFTTNLDTIGEINAFSGEAAAAAARGLLAGVTSTTVVADYHATVVAAIDAIVIGAIPTTNVALTLNQDSGAAFNGTAGNDVFTAGIALDGAGNPKETLQSFDNLNGGAGNDTLNVTLAGASVTPTLANIENINLRSTDAASKLDLSAASGVTNVAFKNSTKVGEITNVGNAALAVSNQNVDANFSGSTATALNLKLDTVGTSDASITVDLAKSAAASATSLAVTAKDAYVNLAESTASATVTSVSVAATGANVIKLSSADAASVKTVTVTGSGSVDLTGNALGAVTSVTGGDGGVKVAITNATAAAVTVTTGAGADSVTATGAGVKSIATGDGKDSVTIGDPALLAAATAANTASATAAAAAATAATAAATAAAAATTATTLKTNTDAAATAVATADATADNSGGSTADLAALKAAVAGAAGINASLKTAVAAATTDAEVRTLVAAEVTAVNTAATAAGTASAAANAASIAAAATAATAVTAATAAAAAAAASGVLGATASVDLGAGDDTLTLKGAFATGATLNGGAGTDTIAMAKGDYSAISLYAPADLAKVTGFEVLSLTDALTTGTYDVSKLAGIGSFTAAAGVAAGQIATVSNLGANATLTLAGALNTNNGAVVATLKTDTAADVLNLVLRSNYADNNDTNVDAIARTETVTATGVETLNINSTGKNTNTATPVEGYKADLVTNTLQLVDNDVVTINVTGNQALNLTSKVGMEKLATVNASANTGGLTFTGAAADVTKAVGMSITGSATASNDLTGTGLKDTIVGGAKADVITGGAGGDTLTGGAGNDTFKFATGDSSIGTGTFDTITDFAANTVANTAGTAAGAADKVAGDILAFAHTGLTVDATKGFKVFVTTTAADATTFLANTASASTGTQASAALDSVANKLYVDVSGDGVADFYIQLNGVATITAAAFTLA